MGQSKPSIPPKKFVKLFEKHGSVKEVARAEKKPYNGVQASYAMAVAEGLMDPVRLGRKSMEHTRRMIKGSLLAKADKDAKPIIGGKLRAMKAGVLPLREGRVTRFLFTSAQNNTYIFDKFWDNLMVFKKHRQAKLCISRFAYIKNGLGARGDKRGWLNAQDNDLKENYRAVQSFWFDPRIKPYLVDERMEVAPGLVFCGEVNILPTKAKPLSGYQVYTGRKSGIFPHVKIAMESIATMQGHATKFNYTTGTVTTRNYIARDAGLKAEFHHCYGALLVEVDEDGNWWCRQINADSEGTIYDLDVCVKNGKLTTGNRLEGFNPGDTHVGEGDPQVFEAIWGKGGLVDTLRPKRTFHNDILNFGPRSHHALKNPHLMFLRYARKTENVREEIQGVIDFLERKSTRPWMETIIVDSNHDRHLARWLAEEDGRRDPVNSQFWIDMQKVTYEAMAATGEEPNHLQLAVRMMSPKTENKFGVQFLPQDASYVICPDAGGGIECGLHGDRGANGARGSAMTIAKMGRKANIGHSHSACIIDGVYQAGTCSIMKLEYNHGASSWSHSSVITYANGKRAILTCWEGRHWA